MEPAQDSQPELRPGDAGFTGFQMHLPENCLEYMLFVRDTTGNTFSALEDVRKAAIRLTDELTGDYIWQRGSFNLELKRDKGLTYLSGQTDYGDSVEDEWLIVYLLRELTKTFKNLWVRVADSDGEFLLVEAANVTPKWLNPENDAHRVWIKDGELKIIPIFQDKKTLSLSDAVGFLKSSPDKLIHSPFIEAEAFYRLEKYPQQITESLHHSMVTIPRKLAHIIHSRPKSIAPATEAFYLRDPLSLKPLFMSIAPLIFPPDDLVTVSIVFTKILFAQLKSQHYDPPPAWQAIIHNAQVASVNDSPATLKTLARLEMGMKITTGYELSAREADKSDNRIVREMAVILGDLEEDGPSALPTDAEIKCWKDVDRDDDESWMNIDYDSFERELDGKDKSGGSVGEGFGDKNTEADLKKIVSRFEAFLNDDKAGIEGAELDEMDEDDDEDEDLEGNEYDEEEDEDDGEDKAVSFDEAQFARMMREMMGFPSDEVDTTVPSSNTLLENPGASSLEAEDEIDEETKEIQKLMAQFEAELKGHGALNLNPKPEKPAKIGDVGKGKQKEIVPANLKSKYDEESESGDDEVDIDYNLAKNLLESFKGQAGLAGPAGNILGMLGINLPQDEGNEDDDEEDEK
ncbi:hypothetical protein DL546_004545 [Coniochaeta pulveracea]|uniref:Regulatory factor Sgt1 n=1 Tax=Coniochaeta pulveracea TaxID=177199 RepID=A0A420Y9D2_9PEZI|nr:hypothetical protein DL546_004545 [Coniochaeta pulveracea]